MVGETIEVEIERIVPGGAGLAHAGGRTLFVMLAAPGDRLRVRVDVVKGKIAFASVVEIIAAGPRRVEPPCPYFGRCGGCDFQQLAYEAQLEAKVEIIRDCLRRIARLALPETISITPAPEVWRYRSRARWQHDARRRQLGYYELASHRICDVAECPVVLSEVQTVLSELRAELQSGTLPAEVKEFQAVAGDDGVSVQPAVKRNNSSEQSRAIGGEHYRFDADCFFQINHALLEPLVREALKNVTGNVADGTSALDLYCGVGLFTLPLARRFAQVNGIEGNARACRFARRNLADANLTNARIVNARAGAWLKREAARIAPVDFVLLDPPRAGTESETLDGIIALRPRRIAYVSCDPATLARDLKKLIAAGCTIDSLAAFDLFPQTHHVETIVHLTTN